MTTLHKRIEGPVAVIGDVHGQLDKLQTVIEKLRSRPDYQDRWIVFIGDYVDRGPDSKGVMDLFCSLCDEHPRTTGIMGNHELAMNGSLGLVPTPEFSNWSERWLPNYQSETTFASYGVPMGDLEGLRNAMPLRHQEIFSSLPWCVEHPNYLFVHAGINSNTPFEMQLRILRARDFTLSRPDWLCSKSLVQKSPPHDCPYTVVVGHVQFPEVQFRPNQILVDTTGGYEGDLSCVLLPENIVISSGVDVPSRQGRGSRASQISGQKKTSRSWLSRLFNG